MSRNGSGVYSLAAGNPVTTGTTISSSWANNTLTDIASALTASIASDGQTVITANLPMSTYAHTGVGVATARTMYGTAGQIQDNTLTYLTTIAGTNVITAVAPVLMSAYATGQTFYFLAAGGNTGAVTVNINAIGAKSVKKTDGSALISGDILTGAAVQIMYDGTNFQLLSDSNGTNETVGNLTVTGTTTATGLITANGGVSGALNGSLGATTPSTVVATDLTTTGNTILGNASTDTLNVGNGDLVKDASGNVGLGIASPSALGKVLNLYGGAGIGSSIALQADNGAQFCTIYQGTTAADPTAIFSNNGFKFATATAKDATGFSEKMRIDSSGNVGIGVTPSAWGGNYKTLQNAAGFIGNYLTGSLIIGQNYYDSAAGAFKYVNTAAASNYEQVSGAHIWSRAASGSAGGTVSFTTAMTLDASSNLTVTGGATIQGLTVGKGGNSSTQSTAIGYQALLNQTDATGYNTAVGYQAAKQTTSGVEVNAFGRLSLASNTTGSELSAFGDSSLYSNTTGGKNTAVGTQALYSNTTASYNTAVGYQALYTNTASYNTAVGYQAGYNNTTGNGAFFGTNAGLTSTTATRVCYIGGNAGASATGSFNTAIGSGAMSGGATTGTDNVAIGAYHDGTLAGPLDALTSGSANVAIGTGVFAGLTTGTGNIGIGYALSSAAVGSDNQIVIGVSAAGKGSNTGFITPNGGGVYQGNNSSTWSTTSDQRLKKNIIDNNEGLALIAAIQVRNFEYRLPEEITELEEHTAIKKEGVQLGVIAQELQVVLPDCVKEESTGVMSVDTSNLTWYLINAIKELKAEIDLLKGAK